MSTTKKYDVVIVGAGPAGIFAALELAAKSDLKVIILDKGSRLENRLCPRNGQRVGCRKCDPCAVVSGWGGAGALSDGKLTFSPGIGGTLDNYIGRKALQSLIEYVDRIYLKYGAPEKVYGVDTEEIEKIARKAKLAELTLVPSRIRHMGTGRTREILQRMYDSLQGKADIALEVRATKLLVEDGAVKGVYTDTLGPIEAEYVIIAPGREGASWLSKEAERLDLPTALNPVDIGVRVELPAAVMEHLTDLIYESKFVYYSRSFDDKVRTFCMCPYGEVVTENNDGLVTVNGHSHAEEKTENTNFAVLVSSTFTEPFKDPISYGRYIAGLANLLGGGVIVQRVGDLIAGRRTTDKRLRKCSVTPTLKDATPGDLSLVFPHRHLVDIMEMLQALDEIAAGCYSRHTLLYGVEVKFYSNRLEVNNQLESVAVRNLFAAGDGAGITRGLVQASASGVVAAREILRRCSGSH